MDRITAPVAALNRGEHLRGLDGVRGLAVVLVLARHLGCVDPAGSAPVAILDAVFMHAWIGVDLFFVLSGFLITGILLRTRSHDGYARSFYARRVLRIFPLYFLALFLVAFVLPRLVPPLAERVASLRGYEWVAFLTFTRNLQQAALLPRLPEDTIGLGHFWSLQVEEQFYLAWPLLVALLSRRALARVCVACVAGCQIARLVGLARLGADEPSTWMFWMTFTRADGLAIGALVALLVETNGVSAPLLRAARTLGAGAAAVFVGCAALDCLEVRYARGEEIWSLRVALPFVAVGGGALLLEVLAAPAGSTVARIFGSRPLTWLGRYSYGIYVYHQILNLDVLEPLGLRDRLGPRSSFVATEAYAAIVVALSLLAAFASYRIYELPFLRLKRLFEPGAARPAAERA